LYFRRELALAPSLFNRFLAAIDPLPMGFVAASVCGHFQSSPRRARLAGILNALGLLVLKAVLDGQRHGLSVGLGRLYALSREDGRACIRGHWSAGRLSTSTARLAGSLDGTASSAAAIQDAAKLNNAGGVVFDPDSAIPR
jgi:hypothetical protein